MELGAVESEQCLDILAELRVSIRTFVCGFASNTTLDSDKASHGLSKDMLFYFKVDLLMELGAFELEQCLDFSRTSG